MTAIAFDTYAFVKKLKSVGFTEEQAAVFAEEQRRIIDERLVTSDHFEARMKDHDVKLEEIRRELANTKAEIIKWVAGMLIAQAAVVAALVKLL